MMGIVDWPALRTEVMGIFVSVAKAIIQRARAQEVIERIEIDAHGEPRRALGGWREQLGAEGRLAHDEPLAPEHGHELLFGSVARRGRAEGRAYRAGERLGNARADAAPTGHQ